MTDELTSIAITDDGTINEMAVQLELLGFTGEAALQRLASAYESPSKSSARAQAAAALYTAAVKASFDAVTPFEAVIKRLVDTEVAALNTQEALTRATALYAVAQREGYEAALAAKNLSTEEIQIRGGLIAAIEEEATATEGLTRLQVNLRASVADYNAKQEAAAAASARAAQTMAEASTATTTLGAETAALSIRVEGLYGTYTGLDTLFAAQAKEAAGAATELAALAGTAERTGGTFAALDRETVALAASTQAATASFAGMAEAAEARLASTASLAGADAELASAERVAASAIEEFIALQREANDYTITGRAATAQAAAAYTTAVEAVGAYNVELELLASNQGRLADSAIRMANGLRSAAVAAEELAAAEAEAATAATSLEARMLAVQESGSKLGKTFGGLGAVIAGAFAVKELVEASDTFTKITVGLATVTTSTAQLNAVYDQLHTVANSTQTSLEGNAKLFVTLADATKGTGTSAQALIGAVGGIDTALKLGNVTGQDAYRVMRSLSEIFSTTGGSAERFIQNLRRESPATFAAVSSAAERLGIDMAEFGGESDKAGGKTAALNAKLAGLQAKADGTGLTLGQAQAGVRKYGNQHTEATKEVDKLRTAIEGTGTVTNAQSKALLAANNTIIRSAAGYNTYAGAVNRAKAAQADHIQGEIAATKAQIASTSATADAAQKQKDLIAIFQNIYVHDSELAQSFTTVAGTLTVLKNNLIDFAGNSNTTSITVGILKDVILILADNLDIVIPSVIAFAALVAVVKVADLAKDVYLLVTGLGSLNLALLPEIAIFTAVTAGVIAFAYGVSVVLNYITNGRTPVLNFTNVMAGLGTVAEGVGAGIKGLTEKIKDNAINAQASKDANSLLTGGLKSTGDAAKGAATDVDAYSKANDAALKGDHATAGANAGLASSFGGVASAANGATAAIGRFSNAQAASANTSKGISSRDLSGATQGYSTSNGGVSQNYVSTNSPTSDPNSHIGKASSGGIGSDATSGTQPGYTYAPAGSNAYGYTGTGILNTDIGDEPSGAYTEGTSIGDNSSYLPSDSTQFRNGGTFHVPGGTGVDSVPIRVSPGEVVTVQTPSQYNAGVVAGYTVGKKAFADGGTTFGAGVELGTGVSPSTSLSDPAGSVTGFTDSRSDAVGILTTAIADQTSSTDANTSATIANTDAFSGANDNTASSTANPYDPAGGGTALGTASPTPAAANANDKYALQNGKLFDVTANRVANSQESYADIAAGTEGKDAYGQRAYIGASGAVYGVATTPLNAFGLGGAQAGIYSADGVTIIPNTGAGASVDGGQNLNNYNSAHARDGADFYVPGGTGVDSKVMQVAVSPGESVHVRTPSQQRAGQQQAPGGNVTINVNAADASSFINSQDQLAGNLVRGLRRAQRRA